MSLINYKNKVVDYFNLQNLVFFISLALINIYIYSWNYSYLPLTEGWFFLSSKFISDSFYPYKDFYAYLPPFYYWYSYFLYNLSDQTIHFARLVGHFNLNILFVLVYFTFRTVFPKIPSILASFIAMFFYLKGNAIISYDFIHLVNIFCLASFVSILYSNKRYSLFLSGVFAMLCLLTKQSNGSVIFLTLFIIFLIKYRDNLRLVIYPFLGSLIILVIFIFPILIGNYFEVFLDNIIFNAGEAKGGITHSLSTLLPPNSDFYSFNNLKRFFINLLLPILILLFFYDYKVLKDFKKNFIKFKEIENNKKFIFISILVSSFILFGFMFFDILINETIKAFNEYFIKYSYLWSGYCFLILFFFLRQNINMKYFMVLLFGLNFASATSAGLTPLSIFLHIGLPIALFTTYKSFINVLLVLSILSLFFIPFDVIKNKNLVYDWWGVKSYIGSYESPQFDSIKGIKNDGLSKQFELIDKKIKKCKSKPSNLISYPHGALMNLVLDIDPPTRVVSYWFDFLSNKHSKEELERLKKIDLDLIAIIDLPNEAYEMHKKLFRKKTNILVQEEIKLFLISQSKNYNLLHKFDSNNIKVEIFNRKQLKCN